MRLLAQNGPMAGGILTLDDGLMLGGPDSRPLCRFTHRGDGRFMVESLDEAAPIFVNGLPVGSRELEVRDELGVGDSSFTVQSVSEDATPAPPPALFACAVEMVHGRSSKVLHQIGFDDALLAPEMPVAPRDGKDLGVLLRAAGALSSVRGLAQLDPAIAGLVLEAVPGARVALMGEPSAPTSLRSAWAERGSHADRLQVDEALVEQAIRDRTAVIVELEDRHALVSSMMAFGRAVGCVWIESRPGTSFDQAHARLLLAVIALAAVARQQLDDFARLEERNAQLRAEINLEHNMVGTSRAMRQLFDRIARVARTDSTILLRGESGTGKELVARAAHRNSPRSDGPFIAINCAALTETLLESELFGHEKGAFTGAIGLKKGKMELAEGGTLFLDEIGELPLTIQAKLLRALQEREFERVGGTRPLRVDFRLIAATNRDLESSSKTGGFRQDLFYRLNVVSLLLPPLRERREDIRLLAEYFVRKHGPRAGRAVHGVDPSALEMLTRYDWPGNVRELENAIEQALALGLSDLITAEDLPTSLSPQPASRRSSSLNYHETVEGTKRDLILRAFEEAEHNHGAAAKLLGVHPNYLHRLVRNYDLRRGEKGR